MFPTIKQIFFNHWTSQSTKAKKDLFRKSTKIDKRQKLIANWREGERERERERESHQSHRSPQFIS